MKKLFLIPIVSFVILLSGCLNSSNDEQLKVNPGNFILVDVADFDKPAYIMRDVQKMLAENPTLAAKVMSHGQSSPTTYDLKFRGLCSDEKALFEAVRIEIRKTSNALVVCTSTPPDPEPGVAPNVPKAPKK